MDELTYKQADVDQIIQQSTGVIQTLLEENVKLAEEREALQQKLVDKSAEAERVELEKVAAESRPAFTAEEVGEFVQTLKSAGFLARESDARTVEEQVGKDHRQLLKLAQHVVTLSAPSPQTGRGLDKHASIGGQASSGKPTDWEADGWDEILRTGRC